MTMTTRRIPEGELQRYFDTYTKLFLRNGRLDTVDIEVLNPAWGDQHEARNARLLGITYDPDSRELDVTFDKGEHRVFAVREVWVAEEPDGFVEAIQIVPTDDTREVLRLARAAPKTLPKQPPPRDADSRAG